MIKKILVSVCLLLSMVSFAQEGSYSPYSFFGIGDQRFKGTADTRAMGGVSIFPDSIHVNLQNPASLSSVKWTTFTVGGTGSWASLETETQSEKAKRVTLDYLAVALPIKKGGIVFGLMPFSSVGYKVRSTSEISEDETLTSNFTGSGGVNRVFVGAGYQITKNFRVGGEFNFNFGTIETTSISSLEGIQFSAREVSESDLSGFGANLGVMYEGKVSSKLRAFGGITYAPQTSLTSKTFRTIGTIQLLQIGGSVIVDQDTISVPDAKLKIPSRFSFGAGIGQPRKWQAGAEVTFTGAKDSRNRFTDIGNATFENAIKYSLGGYYIPNYSSFSSYWSRIVLRAGARYENTGLVLGDHSIHDAAGTLGFGFPITGQFSNLNLTFEYGKRGTKAYGLVEENYFNVSIGFSLNDRWFVRRKYD